MNFGTDRIFVPPMRTIVVTRQDDSQEGFEANAYYPNDDGSLTIVMISEAPAHLAAQGATHFNKCIKLFAAGQWKTAHDATETFKGGIAN